MDVNDGATNRPLLDASASSDGHADSSRHEAAHRSLARLWRERKERYTRVQAAATEVEEEMSLQTQPDNTVQDMDASDLQANEYHELPADDGSASAVALGSVRGDIVIELPGLSSGQDVAVSRMRTTSDHHDRHCFICLGESEPDNRLRACCSTCYACVHPRCWHELRSSQRLAALRSRLLNQRTSHQNMLLCSICKSGTAILAGEESALEWMNDASRGATGSRGASAFAASITGRQSDSDEEEAQLEDIIDRKTFLALLLYAALVALVIFIGCSLVATKRYYAGDIVLCSIMVLYELSVLQLVVIAIMRRRSAVWERAGRPAEAGLTERGVAREVPLLAGGV